MAFGIRRTLQAIKSFFKKQRPQPPKPERRQRPQQQQQRQPPLPPRRPQQPQPPQPAAPEVVKEAGPLHTQQKLRGPSQSGAELTVWKFGNIPPPRPDFWDFNTLDRKVGDWMGRQTRWFDEVKGGVEMGEQPVLTDWYCHEEGEQVTVHRKIRYKADCPLQQFLRGEDKINVFDDEFSP